MKSKLLILFTLFILTNCKKKVEESAPIPTELINDKCLVTKSEVPFDEILNGDRDGFVRIEQQFSADGKFISGNAVGTLFGKAVGENMKLNGFTYNGKSYTIIANNYYNVNTKTESKSANWKMTLADNSVIELCVAKLPKVIVLDKTEKPAKNKDWIVSFDITDNGSDEINLSDNLFFSSSFSNLLHSEYGNSPSFNIKFDKAAVLQASEDAKQRDKKEFTVYIETTKNYLKTINGKKIQITLSNTTVAKYPVF
jgi:hypothetical protein